MKTHDYHAHRILSEIDAGHGSSQRSLSATLGIALGLTNLLVKKLVLKGLVRVIRVRPNRMRYFLTPAGMAEKARMSRSLLQDSVRFYVGARDRLRESLAMVPRRRPDGEADPVPTRIVFYGTGEIAEIAYICLQETDLTLVAVVGDPGGGRFFGLPVQRGEDIRPGYVGTMPFDRLVITTFENAETTRSRLEALGVAPDGVFWL